MVKAKKRVIYLSDDEWAELQELSELKEMSVSDFIRSRIFVEDRLDELRDLIINGFSNMIDEVESIKDLFSAY